MKADDTQTPECVFMNKNYYMDSVVRVHLTKQSQKSNVCTVVMVLATHKHGSIFMTPSYIYFLIDTRTNNSVPCYKLEKVFAINSPRHCRG